MIRRAAPSTSALLLLLVLAGCSSAPAPNNIGNDAPAAADAAEDVTEALVAANHSASWIDEVVTATKTEPTRVEITTTIVDPRGDAGSVEGVDAVAICNAAVATVAGVEAVAIYEADGTTFAGLRPNDAAGCVEY